MLMFGQQVVMSCAEETVEMKVAVSSVSKVLLETEERSDLKIEVGLHTCQRAGGSGTPAAFLRSLEHLPVHYARACRVNGS